MKKLTTLLSLFVLLTAFTCENESLEGDFSTETSEGSFSVDFDGQTYFADIVGAIIIENSMNITASRGSQQELITITLMETTAGTYDIGVTDQATMLVNGAAYNSASGSSDTWVAVTDFMTPQGTITISEINESDMTMSGTFSFTAHSVTGEPKEFTNGVFTNIPYEDSLDSIPTENTFFAKVDGEEFVEDVVFGNAISLAGFNSIGISATKNSAETIGFSLDASITEGTYNFVSIASSPSDTIGLYNASTTETYTANGTITITTHDVANKRIVATFEFTAEPATGGGATGTHEITEGAFDIVYQ